jgi:hypothetical protein
MIGLILVVRLLFEMRGCTRGVVLLLASASALTTAILAATGYLPAKLNVSPLLIFVGGQLVAALCLLATVLIYGRHVLLDIEGRLSAKGRKSKKRVRAASQDRQPSDKAGSERRTSDSSSIPRPQSGGNVYSLEEDRAQSRAERKRLRREMRRQQRAA